MVGSSGCNAEEMMGTHCGTPVANRDTSEWKTNA